MQNEAPGSSRGRPCRLAILAESPIPYHIAFYRALAAHPELEVMVLYLSDLGLSGRIDPGFGIPLAWGMPLLEGYPHRFLKNVPLSPAPGRFLSLINLGIFAALRKGRYDAALIPGYAYLSYWIGFLSAWTLRIPVLLRGEAVVRPARLQGLKGRLKKGLYRGLLKRVRACLAIGEASYRFYRAFGVPEERIFRSPYAVDNEFFLRESGKWRSRQADTKRSLGLDPGRPVILFCGKLAPRKRPEDLLEAFLRLKRPATLLFAGEGPLRSALQKKAAGHPEVVFAGFVPQAELPKYYGLADLFVLPSSEMEASPLTINEALACGLPAILSDAIPSAPEFVRPGENGFLFPVGDVEALRDRLDTLLRDETLRKKMGEESALRIQAWNPHESVAGVLEALRFAVARCG